MANPHVLEWPAGQPRTRHRSDGKFRHQSKPITPHAALARLQGELNRLGATNPVITSDWPRNLDGSFSARAPFADPAVAVHFVLFDKATVFACDRWNALADNIAAIAAHIEALRGMDRWGVGSIEQAFAGYVALPAPEQWWQVLGCKPDTPLATVEQVHRELAKRHHPDRGGSDAMMARVNAALDQARTARA